MADEILEAVVEPVERSEVDKAKELLAKTENDIRQQCAKEIEVILEKYGFILKINSSIVLERK